MGRQAQPEQGHNQPNEKAYRDRNRNCCCQIGGQNLHRCQGGPQNILQPTAFQFVEHDGITRGFQRPLHNRRNHQSGPQKFQEIPPIDGHALFPGSQGKHCGKQGGLNGGAHQGHTEPAQFANCLAPHQAKQAHPINPPKPTGPGNGPKYRRNARDGISIRCRHARLCFR